MFAVVSDGQSLQALLVPIWPESLFVSQVAEAGETSQSIGSSGPA